jgi:regulatory protein
MPKTDSRKPPASPPTASAYVTALSILARRELSERQMRERLARRGFGVDDVHAAIDRLKSERALDDARVAGAIARTQTAIKRRGRIRVRQAIEQAGISRDIAQQALDETFADVDDDALLETALGRRLKEDRLIANDREFQRLYRYLVGQGFESDRVLRALSARRGRR